MTQILKTEYPAVHAERIYDDHGRFSWVVHYLLTYALQQLTAYVAVILAYYQNDISAVSGLFLAAFVFLKN